MDDTATEHFFKHGRFPSKDIYSETGRAVGLDEQFNIPFPGATAAHIIQYNQVKGESFRRVILDGTELVTDKGEIVTVNMFHSLQHLRQMIENGDAMLEDAFNEDDEEPKPKPASNNLCKSCVVNEYGCHLNPIGSNIVSCGLYEEGPSYDESEFNECVEKGTKAWKGVDVRELRDPRQEEDKELSKTAVWIAMWVISVAAIGTVLLAGWKLVDIVTLITKGLCK